MVRSLKRRGVVAVVAAAVVTAVDSHSEAVEFLDWTETKAWIWFVGGAEHDYSATVAEEADYYKDMSGQWKDQQAKCYSVSYHLYGCWLNLVFQRVA